MHIVSRRSELDGLGQDEVGQDEVGQDGQGGLNNVALWDKARNIGNGDLASRPDQGGVRVAELVAKTTVPRSGLMWLG